MVRTSFVYHQVSAVTSFLATALFLWWVVKNWNRTDLQTLAFGMLLLSINWGVHGLLHFWEENLYNYDPLLGRTEMLTEPIRS